MEIQDIHLGWTREELVRVLESDPSLEMDDRTLMSDEFLYAEPVGLFGVRGKGLFWCDDTDVLFRIVWLYDATAAESRGDANSEAIRVKLRERYGRPLRPDMTLDELAMLAAHDPRQAAIDVWVSGAEEIFLQWQISAPMLMVVPYSGSLRPPWLGPLEIENDTNDDEDDEYGDE